MEKLELNKSTYLFDLDGTLVDSSKYIVKAVQMTRADLGTVVINDGLITSKIGLPADRLFEDLNLEASELKLAVSTFREHLRALSMSEKDAYPGVVSLLEFLSSFGHKLAVATNKPRDLAIKALQETEIMSLFSLVVGSDYLPPKPNPEILNECIKTLRSTPTETVMVGDRTEDMMAASSAGVTGIAIAQTFHSEKQLLDSGADIVAKNFYELERIVRVGVQS